MDIDGRKLYKFAIIHSAHCRINQKPATYFNMMNRIKRDLCRHSFFKCYYSASMTNND